MNNRIIAPSFLASDFSDGRKGIEEIEKSGAEWVHLDVMDGRFVPNLTFGPKMVADLNKNTQLFLDVHLMIEKPSLSAKQYIDAGADALTFHLEAEVHSHRLLQYIKEAGIMAGISIVPSTPASSLIDLLDMVDLILIMSVNPGFGGQKMIYSTLTKVEQLVRWREEQGLNYKIALDGGVNLSTLDAVNRVNPDVLVAGSAFFNASDKNDFVAKLKNM